MKFISIFFYTLLLFSCQTNSQNKEIKKELFIKFQFALGDNEFNNTQCLVEIQKNEDDTKKIALPKECKIYIDSIQLSFDNEIYPNYSTEIEANYFIGKHKWLIDFGKEIKKEIEFEVAPFKLKNDIPKKIGNTDLKIECENLKSTDLITLLISGELSDNSETYLEIKPNDGFFIIPKDFLRKVDAKDLEIRFNISRKIIINDDNYFGNGIEIEITKITKDYETKIIR